MSYNYVIDRLLVNFSQITAFAVFAQKLDVSCRKTV